MYRLAFVVLMAVATPLSAQSVVAADPGFCPIQAWVGPCDLLADDMAHVIRHAVDTHVRTDVVECVRARDTLYRFLDERGHMVWTFSGTVLDTPRMHDAANTVRGADGRAVGVGFRLSSLRRSSAIQIARIAIHEATHMVDTVKDERHARQMERLCISGHGQS